MDKVFEPYCAHTSASVDECVWYISNRVMMGCPCVSCSRGGWGEHTNNPKYEDYFTPI